MMIFIGIIFLLMPFISIIFILIGIILSKNKLYYCFLIALIFSLLGYIFIPWENQSFDIIHRYQTYNIYSRLSFLELREILKRKFDFLYDYFVWGLGYLRINKQILPFLGVFIYYFGQFLILNKFYKERRNKNKNIDFLIFFFYIITSLLVSFISQIRGPLAAGILSLGYFFYLQGFKLGYILFLVIAPLIHFGLLPISIILLINNFIIKYKIWRKFYKYFLGIFIFISLRLESIFTLLLNFPISPYIKIRIENHIFGKWSERSSDIVYTELLNICFIIIIIIIIFLKKQNYKKEIESLIVLLVMFILVNITSRTNLMRYGWYCQSYFIGYLYYIIPKIKFKVKNFIRLYLVGLIIGKILIELYFTPYLDYAMISLENEDVYRKNIYQILKVDVDDYKNKIR